MSSHLVKEVDHEAIRKKIVECYAACPGGDAKAEFEFRTLSQILGPREKGLWWRLYINPKDQAKALAKHPEDPGIYYDKDRKTSEGTKVAMLNTYTKYLDGEPGALIDFKFDTYNAIHEASIPRNHEGTPTENYSLNVEGSITFPTGKQLADDIWGEIILKRPFISNDLKPVKNPWTVFFPDLKEGPAITSLGTKDWPSFFADVADTFQVEMLKVTMNDKSWVEVLEVIARLIRRLHVCHMWSNGNGRTNVFTLLPMLMLENGFGLPLGGAFRNHYPKDAMDEMFNGPYTVKEIAMFLWTYQDFGLEAKDRTKTIIYDKE